ncbi:MAG: hypothetical protein ACOYJA_09005 [Christensenellales bacterium]|jgi:hypothetical protein
MPRNIIKFNSDGDRLDCALDVGGLWKNFTPKNLVRVKVASTETKVLFFTKKVEALEMYDKGDSDPYVMNSKKTEEYEWAKGVVKNFCEKNKIPFEE